jgi:hypothetical protein
MISRLAARFALTALALQSAVVGAHSASDAYFNLSVDHRDQRGAFVAHGQWDIALRDLDFVLKLDDDGDGRLTWDEVRRHQAAIGHYAYTTLGIDGNADAACMLKPVRQMIDDHADGAYAALFFDVVCARAPRKLRLHYTLFFDIDPSHRCIFVMHDGANTSTAVMSPEKATIDLAL